MTLGVYVFLLFLLLSVTHATNHLYWVSESSSDLLTLSNWRVSSPSGSQPTIFNPTDHLYIVLHRPSPIVVKFDLAAHVSFASLTLGDSTDSGEPPVFMVPTSVSSISFTTVFFRSGKFSGTGFFYFSNLHLISSAPKIISTNVKIKLDSLLYFDGLVTLNFEQNSQLEIGPPFDVKVQSSENSELNLLLSSPVSLPVLVVLGTIEFQDSSHVLMNIPVENRGIITLSGTSILELFSPLSNYHLIDIEINSKLIILSATSFVNEPLPDSTVELNDGLLFYYDARSPNRAFDLTTSKPKLRNLAPVNQDLYNAEYATLASYKFDSENEWWLFDTNQNVDTKFPGGSFRSTHSFATEIMFDSLQQGVRAGFGLFSNNGRVSITSTYTCSLGINMCANMYSLGFFDVEFQVGGVSGKSVTVVVASRPGDTSMRDVYIDGILVGSSSIPSGSGHSRTFNLGYVEGNGINKDHPMSGKIKSFRMYNRPLTAAEIRSLYQRASLRWTSISPEIRGNGVIELKSDFTISKDFLFSFSGFLFINSAANLHFSSDVTLNHLKIKEIDTLSTVSFDSTARVVDPSTSITVTGGSITSPPLVFGSSIHDLSLIGTANFNCEQLLFITHLSSSGVGVLNSLANIQSSSLTLKNAELSFDNSLSVTKDLIIDSSITNFDLITSYTQIVTTLITGTFDFSGVVDFGHLNPQILCDSCHLISTFPGKMIIQSHVVFAVTGVSTFSTHLRLDVLGTIKVFEGNLTLEGPFDSDHTSPTFLIDTNAALVLTGTWTVSVSSNLLTATSLFVINHADIVFLDSSRVYGAGNFFIQSSTVLFDTIQDSEALSINNLFIYSSNVTFYSSVLSVTSVEVSYENSFLRLVDSIVAADTLLSFKNAGVLYVTSSLSSILLLSNVIIDSAGIELDLLQVQIITLTLSDSYRIGTGDLIVNNFLASGSSFSDSSTTICTENCLLNDDHGNSISITNGHNLTIAGEAIISATNIDPIIFDLKQSFLSFASDIQISHDTIINCEDSIFELTGNLEIINSATFTVTCQFNVIGSIKVSSGTLILQSSVDFYGSLLIESAGSVDLYDGTYHFHQESGFIFDSNLFNFQSQEVYIIIEGLIELGTVDCFVHNTGHFVFLPSVQLSVNCFIVNNGAGLTFNGVSFTERSSFLINHGTVNFVYEEESFEANILISELNLLQGAVNFQGGQIDAVSLSVQGQDSELKFVNSKSINFNSLVATDSSIIFDLDDMISLTSVDLLFTDASLEISNQKLEIDGSLNFYNSKRIGPGDLVIQRIDFTGEERQESLLTLSGSSFSDSSTTICTENCLLNDDHGNSISITNGHNLTIAGEAIISATTIDPIIFDLKQSFLTFASDIQISHDTVINCEDSIFELTGNLEIINSATFTVTCQFNVIGSIKVSSGTLILQSSVDFYGSLLIESEGSVDLYDGTYHFHQESGFIFDSNLFNFQSQEVYIIIEGLIELGTVDCFVHNTGHFVFLPSVQLSVNCFIVNNGAGLTFNGVSFTERSSFLINHGTVNFVYEEENFEANILISELNLLKGSVLIIGGNFNTLDLLITGENSELKFVNSKSMHFNSLVATDSSIIFDMDDVIFLTNVDLLFTDASLEISNQKLEIAGSLNFYNSKRIGSGELVVGNLFISGGEFSHDSLVSTTCLDLCYFSDLFTNSFSLSNSNLILQGTSYFSPSISLTIDLISSNLNIINNLEVNGTSTVNCVSNSNFNLEESSNTIITNNAEFTINCSPSISGNLEILNGKFVLLSSGEISGTIKIDDQGSALFDGDSYTFTEQSKLIVYGNNLEFSKSNVQVLINGIYRSFSCIYHSIGSLTFSDSSTITTECIIVENFAQLFVNDAEFSASTFLLVKQGSVDFNYYLEVNSINLANLTLLEGDVVVNGGNFNALDLLITGENSELKFVNSKSINFDSLVATDSSIIFDLDDTISLTNVDLLLTAASLEISNQKLEIAGFLNFYNSKRIGAGELVVGNLFISGGEFSHDSLVSTTCLDLCYFSDLFTNSFSLSNSNLILQGTSYFSPSISLTIDLISSNLNIINNLEINGTSTVNCVSNSNFNLEESSNTIITNNAEFTINCSPSISGNLEILNGKFVLLSSGEISGTIKIDEQGSALFDGDSYTFTEQSKLIVYGNNLEFSKSNVQVLINGIYQSFSCIYHSMGSLTFSYSSTITTECIIVENFAQLFVNDAQSSASTFLLVKQGSVDFNYNLEVNSINLANLTLIEGDVVVNGGNFNALDLLITGENSELKFENSKSINFNSFVATDSSIIFDLHDVVSLTNVDLLFTDASLEISNQKLEIDGSLNFYNSKRIGAGELVVGNLFISGGEFSHDSLVSTTCLDLCYFSDLFTNSFSLLNSNLILQGSSYFSPSISLTIDLISSNLNIINNLEINGTSTVNCVSNSNFNLEESSNTIITNNAEFTINCSPSISGNLEILNGNFVLLSSGEISASIKIDEQGSALFDGDSYTFTEQSKLIVYGNNLEFSKSNVQVLINGIYQSFSCIYHSIGSLTFSDSSTITTECIIVENFAQLFVNDAEFSASTFLLVKQGSVDFNYNLEVNSINLANLTLIEGDVVVNGGNFNALDLLITGENSELKFVNSKSVHFNSLVATDSSIIFDLDDVISLTNVDLLLTAASLEISNQKLETAGFLNFYNSKRIGSGELVVGSLFISGGEFSHDSLVSTTCLDLCYFSDLFTNSFSLSNSNLILQGSSYFSPSISLTIDLISSNLNVINNLEINGTSTVNCVSNFNFNLEESSNTIISNNAEFTINCSPSISGNLEILNGKFLLLSSGEISGTIKIDEQGSALFDGDSYTFTEQSKLIVYGNNLEFSKSNVQVLINGIYQSFSCIYHSIGSLTFSDSSTITTECIIVENFAQLFVNDAEFSASTFLLVKQGSVDFNYNLEVNSINLANLTLIEGDVVVNGGNFNALDLLITGENSELKFVNSKSIHFNSFVATDSSIIFDLHDVVSLTNVDLLFTDASLEISNQKLEIAGSLNFYNSKRIGAGELVVGNLFISGGEFSHDSLVSTTCLDLCYFSDLFTNSFSLSNSSLLLQGTSYFSPSISLTIDLISSNLNVINNLEINGTSTVNCVSNSNFNLKESSNTIISNNAEFTIHCSPSISGNLEILNGKFLLLSSGEISGTIKIDEQGSALFDGDSYTFTEQSKLIVYGNNLEFSKSNVQVLINGIYQSFSCIYHSIGSLTFSDSSTITTECIIVENFAQLFVNDAEFSASTFLLVKQGSVDFNYNLEINSINLANLTLIEGDVVVNGGNFNALDLLITGENSELKFVNSKSINFDSLVATDSSIIFDMDDVIFLTNVDLLFTDASLEISNQKLEIAGSLNFYNSKRIGSGELVVGNLFISGGEFSHDSLVSTTCLDLCYFSDLFTNSFSLSNSNLILQGTSYFSPSISLTIDLISSNLNIINNLEINGTSTVNCVSNSNFNLEESSNTIITNNAEFTINCSPSISGNLEILNGKFLLLSSGEISGTIKIDDQGSALFDGDSYTFTEQSKLIVYGNNLEFSKSNVQVLINGIYQSFSCIYHSIGSLTFSDSSTITTECVIVENFAQLFVNNPFFFDIFSQQNTKVFALKSMTITDGTVQFINTDKFSSELFTCNSCELSGFDSSLTIQNFIVDSGFFSSSLVINNISLSVLLTIIDGVSSDLNNVEIFIYNDATIIFNNQLSLTFVDFYATGSPLIIFNNDVSFSDVVYSTYDSLNFINCPTVQVNSPSTFYEEFQCNWNFNCYSTLSFSFNSLVSLSGSSLFDSTLEFTHASTLILNSVTVFTESSSINCAKCLTTTSSSETYYNGTWDVNDTKFTHNAGIFFFDFNSVFNFNSMELTGGVVSFLNSPFTFSEINLFNSELFLQTFLETFNIDSIISVDSTLSVSNVQGSTLISNFIANFSIIVFSDSLPNLQIFYLYECDTVFTFSTNHVVIVNQFETCHDVSNYEFFGPDPVLILNPLNLIFNYDNNYQCCPTDSCSITISMPKLNTLFPVTMSLTGSAYHALVNQDSELFILSQENTGIDFSYDFLEFRLNFLRFGLSVFPIPICPFTVRSISSPSVIGDVVYVRGISFGLDFHPILVTVAPLGIFSLQVFPQEHSLFTFEVGEGGTCLPLILEPFNRPLIQTTLCYGQASIHSISNRILPFSGEVSIIGSNLPTAEIFRLNFQGATVFYSLLSSYYTYSHVYFDFICHVTSPSFSFFIDSDDEEGKSNSFDIHLTSPSFFVYPLVLLPTGGKLAAFGPVLGAVLEPNCLPFASITTPSANLIFEIESTEIVKLYLTSITSSSIILIKFSFNSWIEKYIYVGITHFTVVPPSFSFCFVSLDCHVSIKSINQNDWLQSNHLSITSSTVASVSFSISNDVILLTFNALSIYPYINLCFDLNCLGVANLPLTLSLKSINPSVIIFNHFDSVYYAEISGENFAGLSESQWASLLSLSEAVLMVHDLSNSKFLLEISQVITGKHPLSIKFDEDNVQESNYFITFIDFKLPTIIPGTVVVVYYDYDSPISIKIDGVIYELIEGENLIDLSSLDTCPSEAIISGGLNTQTVDIDCHFNFGLDYDEYGVVDVVAVNHVSNISLILPPNFQSLDLEANCDFDYCKILDLIVNDDGTLLVVFEIEEEGIATINLEITENNHKTQFSFAVNAILTPYFELISQNLIFVGVSEFLYLTAHDYVAGGSFVLSLLDYNLQFSLDEMETLVKVVLPEFNHFEILRPNLYWTRRNFPAVFISDLTIASVSFSLITSWGTNLAPRNIDFNFSEIDSLWKTSCRINTFTFPAIISEWLLTCPDVQIPIISPLVNVSLEIESLPIFSSQISVENPFSFDCFVSYSEFSVPYISLSVINLLNISNPSYISSIIFDGVRCCTDSDCSVVFSSFSSFLIQFDSIFDLKSVVISIKSDCSNFELPIIFDLSSGISFSPFWNCSSIDNGLYYITSCRHTFHQSLISDLIELYFQSTLEVLEIEFYGYNIHKCHTPINLFQGLTSLGQEVSINTSIKIDGTSFSSLEDLISLNFINIDFIPPFMIYNSQLTSNDCYNSVSNYLLTYHPGDVYVVDLQSNDVFLTDTSLDIICRDSLGFPVSCAGIQINLLHSNLPIIFHDCFDVYCQISFNSEVFELGSHVVYVKFTLEHVTGVSTWILNLYQPVTSFLKIEPIRKNDCLNPYHGPFSCFILIFDLKLVHNFPTFSQELPLSLSSFEVVSNASNLLTTSESSLRIVSPPNENLELIFLHGVYNQSILIESANCTYPMIYSAESRSCRCSPGFSLTHAFNCEPCRPDTYSDYNTNQTCLDCPNFRFTKQSGSSGLSSCVCHRNSFLKNEECVKCPPLMKCYFGEGELFTNGLLFENVYQPEQCWLRHLCVNNTCSQGHSGRNCLDCLDDYKMMGSSCRDSSTKSWIISISIVFILFILCFAAVEYYQYQVEFNSKILNMVSLSLTRYHKKIVNKKLKKPLCSIFLTVALISEASTLEIGGVFSFISSSFAHSIPYVPALLSLIIFYLIFVGLHMLTLKLRQKKEKFNSFYVYETLFALMLLPQSVFYLATYSYILFVLSIVPIGIVFYLTRKSLHFSGFLVSFGLFLSGVVLPHIYYRTATIFIMLFSGLFTVKVDRYLSLTAMFIVSVYTVYERFNVYNY
ncbi:hypothetical protein RCL1_001537 [Eukaryota sp. TZLM3-RCL]